MRGPEPGLPPTLRSPNFTEQTNGYPFPPNGPPQGAGQAEGSRGTAIGRKSQETGSDGFFRVALAVANELFLKTVLRWQRCTSRTPTSWHLNAVFGPSST